MAPSGRERQLILFAVAALAGGVVLLWTLYLIASVLLVVYVSGLLAVGFSPIIRRFERGIGPRRRVLLPRWAAVLALYVGAIALLGLVLVIVLPPFVRQATALWLDLPLYLDRLQDTLIRYGITSGRWTSADVLAQLPSPGFLAAQVMGALKSVVGVAVTIVTVVILPYYLLLEADAIRDNFIKLFARAQRLVVARLTERVTIKVGAWLMGQLLLSGIMGAAVAIGLWLLGKPYFYVFGVLAALGSLVPIIGPILAAAPAILVAFSLSVRTGIFVASYIGVLQFLEGNLIVPRLMEKQVGVSAVTVIIALLIGTQLLGITGALLAVPTAAIVQVLAQEYLERD